MVRLTLFQRALLMTVFCPTIAFAETLPVVPSVDLRARHEYVDQSGLPRDAHATTLRIRPGLKFGPVEGLAFYAEADAIVSLDTTLYNDTANGRTDRPVVADAEAVVLNQLYLRWQGKPGVTATIGRQTVNYDNQRWVGSVAWRQNDQTLDAVQLSLDPAPGRRVSATYAYVWRVNRVFGPNSSQGALPETDIHLGRIGLEIAQGNHLTAYFYDLGLPSAPTLSSRTLGVRVNGAIPVGKLRILYALEAARQKPIGANPGNANHSYWLIEPGISIAGITARVGHERLEGNGRTALQTPLATLHAFNGWADKFLLTPVEGLADTYVDFSVRLPDRGVLARGQLRVMAHDFRATRSDQHYGREIGGSATIPLTRSVSATMKMAHYEAATFATNTTKFWFELTAKY